MSLVLSVLATANLAYLIGYLRGRKASNDAWERDVEKMRQSLHP